MSSSVDLATFDLRVIARQLLEHLSSGTTDSAPGIRQVAVEQYTDAGVAAQEREQVFGRVPVVVAHSSELAGPGRVVPVDLATSRAILVRQPGGEVRAFVNACRHRGSELVAECSTVRRLSCPYHGWSYDLDGALHSLPAAGTFGDLDRSTRGLVELPCEERHGLIWVTDSPGGGSAGVESWLGPKMDALLDSYGLDEHWCFRRASFHEKINWKVLVDAFCDNYHISFVHRNSVAKHFYNNTLVADRLGRHVVFYAARKRIDSLADRDSFTEAEALQCMTVTNFLVPNATLIRQPDHFELLVFFPDRDDPGACRMDLYLLAPDDGRSDEAVERWEENWRIMHQVLVNEDLVINGRLQRSIAGGAIGSVVLGRNEIVNQAFHEELERLRRTGEPGEVEAQVRSGVDAT